MARPLIVFLILTFNSYSVVASENPGCAAGDASCSTDYESMLQAHILVKDVEASPATVHHHHAKAAPKKQVPAADPNSHPEDALHGEDKKKVLEKAEEPEMAPKWYVSMLVFFVFAFGVLFILVLCLALLQLMVRWQQRNQEAYLKGLDDAAAKVEKKPAAAEIKEPEGEIDAKEVAQLMAGDHTRLNKLLAIAEGPAPEAAMTELVKKASGACKLKLSPQAQKHASQGLVVLMKTAQETHQKRLGDFKAKETLQKAFKRVLMMVKVRRAFKMPDKKEVDLAVTCNEKHEEHHTEKYADGKSAGKYKDTRLAKSSIQAYLSSEKFLDHTAILFVFVYSQVCALIYAMYLKYRFPKMYAFMGPWLLVSRGEAMAIIVITMLMVLLLTRGFLTGCRSYMSWSTVLQTLADKHVLIHRYCGMMLVVCAVLHIIGHLKGSIPAIIGETDSSQINKAFTYGTKIKFNFNTWREAFASWPAVTGIVLVVILALFWALSNEKVRRYSFELFHYPHLVLIWAWTGMLIAHGWKQWLGCGVPLGFLAVFPVMLLYVLERLLHIKAGHDPSVKIKAAVVKKRQVLLTIDTGCSGMYFTTGMYCMLKCPEISEFEWHPFTIASGGGQHDFQVLFAIVGDWTTKLSELISEAQKAGKPLPRLCIRGGYGAPAEGMKDHKHIVMVGGGVGATPFLSFLSNITNSAQTGDKDPFEAVESAVFYWVSREADDFAWVNQYATVIASTPKLKDRISIRLCLTKALEATATGDCSATEIALFWLGVQIGVTKYKSKELSTELGAPTQFGRPNWNNEFASHVKELSKKDKGELEVSVFACGNQMLVDSLEQACATLTDEKVKLRLYAEEF